MKPMEFIQAGTPSPYSVRYLDFLRASGWDEHALSMLMGDILRFETVVMRHGHTLEDGLHVLVQDYDSIIIDFLTVLESKMKMLAAGERNFALQKDAVHNNNKEASRMMSGEEGNGTAGVAAATLQVILAGSEEDEGEEQDAG